MMRPLIVGQAPSASSDPAEPLSGRSGRRLASLCCLPLDEFLAGYDRINLVRQFPGKLSKGDAFPIGQARTKAVIIRGGLTPRRLVLLGSGVARAFQVPAGTPPLRWFPLGHHRAAICPHPSGVCQWWNDPRSVGQARSFWLELEQARAAGLRRDAARRLIESEVWDAVGRAAAPRPGSPPRRAAS